MRSAVTEITTNGAAQLVLGVSPHRQSLTVFAPSAGTLAFGRRAPANATDGIVMGLTGLARYTFTRAVHGDYLDGPFFIFASAAANLVVLVEGLED